MDIAVLNQDGGFSRQGVQAIRAIVLEVLAEQGALPAPDAPEPESASVKPTPATALNDSYALRQAVESVLSEKNAVSPGVSEDRVMELIDAQARNRNASGRLSAVYNQALTH